MALASKILQRVIVTPTATQIRGATLLAGAFADTGLLLPADLLCANVDATDVGAGTAEITALTLNASPVPAGGVLVSFLSPQISLTALGSTVFPGTTLPGFTFAPTGAHFICSEATGAILAAPVTKAGNDGGQANILSSQSFPSTAQFALGKNSVANQTTAAKPVAMIDLTTPITFVVVTAATTGSTLSYKGFFRIFGFLTATVP